MALPAGTSRLYGLCALLALGSSIWGFDIGIWSSIMVHPGWRKAMREPDASDRGALTAVYYMGTLLSYLLISHPLADRLGRRYAALTGTVVLSVGAIVMGAASSVGIMALGRWICGIGVAITSTTVPLYQSEVSPAPERGKFVTMNHVGFIAGLACGLWVGYGMTFWTGPAGEFWGWRVTILLQLVPVVIFAVGLPFLPETPRWLVEKGHPERARRVLHWLRQDTKYHASVTHELHAISNDVDARPRPGPDSHQGHSTYSSIVRSLALSLTLVRQPALRARLWRAFLLQFLAQMCGAAAMKYYLPSLLKALGVDTRLALMAGAVEMTIKIGMTIIEMWIIDRVGRKTCLVGGSTLMAIAMLINGALPLAYPNNKNKAADVACIVFIFVYAVGYSLGLGPAAWVYSSEIFPTSVRARGLNFAASGGSVGSIIVSHVWPLGLSKWGSGVYFFFMLVNVACAPIIWMFYPETKGRELEDMDALFGETPFSGNGAPLTLSDSADGDGDEEAGQHHVDTVPTSAAAAEIREGEEEAGLLNERHD